MYKENNTLAVILIVVGVALMVRKFVPELGFLFEWPTWGFLVAGLLILLGSIQRDGELAFVASLLAGVSVNVLLQRQMGLMVWVSMLTFLGVGIMLSGLIEPKKPGEIRSGFVLVITSVVVYLLAGGTEYLPWPHVTTYWPVGLVIIGLLILVSTRSSKLQS